MKSMKQKRRFLAVAAGCLAAFAIAGVAVTAKAVGRVQIQVGEFALEKGVFNSIFAKEMCSCVFVDGIDLPSCEARDNLPSVAIELVNLEVDPDRQTVTSSYKGYEALTDRLHTLGIPQFVLGGPASAQLDPDHPEYGCVLTELPSDSDE
jgi:hypothetical protein